MWSKIYKSSDRMRLLCYLLYINENNIMSSLQSRLPAWQWGWGRTWRSWSRKWRPRKWSIRQCRSAARQIWKQVCSLLFACFSPVRIKYLEFAELGNICSRSLFSIQPKALRDVLFIPIQQDCGPFQWGKVKQDDGFHQREGVGLLEDQAMPFFHVDPGQLCSP